jgi:hypothetical protein
LRTYGAEVAKHDEFDRRVAAMTIEELIAELDKGDPKVVRAALEEALIDVGLTNADLRALLETAVKLNGPVKH